MEFNITKKQAQVAMDMIFDGGGMTTGQILERHGVTAREYSKWLRDGSYGRYLRYLSESAAAGDRPRVMRKLAELSAEGDTKAIKMFLDALVDAEEDSEVVRFPRGDIEELKREIWGDNSV